jgi:RNA polymerase sigma-70 factor, ECF subfamily
MAIEPLHWDQGPPEESPEVVLISRAKAGDGEAFAEIYRLYRPQVMRLALARLRDALTAEEVVQETFLRALRRLDAFDVSRPLGPWLATIASHLVIDSYRTGERLVPTDRAGEVLPHSGADPTLDAVLAAEGVRNLQHAISLLPARQRRILIGSTIHNLSPAELARQENVSEASVTSVVYRARQAVRRSLRRLAVVLLVFRAARARVREQVSSMASALTVTAAEAGVSSLMLSVALIVAGASGYPPGRASPTTTHPALASPVERTIARSVAPPSSEGSPVSPGAGSSASLRTSIGAKAPRRDAAAPSSGRVRIEVVGPDGTTWQYADTGFSCGGTPWMSQPPAGPVRVSC